MKISRNQYLKTILILFLIVSGNSLDVASNIKLFASKNKNSINTENFNKPKSNRKNETKEDTCQYGEEYPIDILTLILTAKSVIRSSFYEDVVKLIFTNKYWTKLKEEHLNKECRTLIERAFNQEIERIKIEKNLEKQVIEENNKFEENVSKTWINNEEKELIIKNKDNPKRLCEINTEILGKNNKESEEWVKQGKFLIERIDRIIENKYTIQHIKEKSNADKDKFSGNGLLLDRKRYLTAYKYLYDRLKDLDNQNHEQLKVNLLNIKEETIESVSVAQQNLNDYKEFTIPNCKILPTSKKKFGKCLIVGYLTYFKAFWNMAKNFKGEKIDKEYLSECIRNEVFDTVIDMVRHFLVETLLTFLTGIIGLVIHRFVKIVYYAVNIIYNFVMIVEDNNSLDIEKRSIAFGRIIGYSVKAVMTFFHLGKKKRISKK